jgi:hypothetical protein
MWKSLMTWTIRLLCLMVLIFVLFGTYIVCSMSYYHYVVKARLDAYPVDKTQEIEAHAKAETQKNLSLADTKRAATEESKNKFEQKFFLTASTQASAPRQPLLALDTPKGHNGRRRIAVCYGKEQEFFAAYTVELTVPDSLIVCYGDQSPSLPPNTSGYKYGIKIKVPTEKGTTEEHVALVATTDANNPNLFVWDGTKLKSNTNFSSGLREVIMSMNDFVFYKGVWFTGIPGIPLRNWKIVVNQRDINGKPIPAPRELQLGPCYIAVWPDTGDEKLPEVLKHCDKELIDAFLNK